MGNSPAVHLDAMTPGEFEQFCSWAIPNYADDLATSGAHPPALARQRAEEQFAELLPDGVESPGQWLFTARDGGQRVGMLWLGVRRKVGPTRVWVYDVYVEPDLRGRGYGRAIMLAAEAECRRRGMTEIGLNVFGNNAVARRLYDALGYQVTAVNMRKELG